MSPNETLTKEIPNGDRAPKGGNPRVGKGDTLNASVMIRRNAELVRKANASLVTYTFVSDRVASMVFDGTLSLDFCKFYGLAIAR